MLVSVSDKPAIGLSITSGRRLGLLRLVEGPENVDLGGAATVEDIVVVPTTNLLKVYLVIELCNTAKFDAARVTGDVVKLEFSTSGIGIYPSAVFPGRSLGLGGTA